MIWYSARLLFASSVDGAPDEAPLYDEGIYVLRARSDDAAYARAAQIGRDNEHEYPNDQNAMVRWRFLRVLDVKSLDTETIDDGLEVYSRISPRPPA